MTFGILHTDLYSRWFREFRQKTSPSLINLKSPADSRRSSKYCASPTPPTPPSASSGSSPKSYFSSPDYNSNNSFDKDKGEENNVQFCHIYKLGAQGLNSFFNIQYTQYRTQYKTLESYNIKISNNIFDIWRKTSTTSALAPKEVPL